MPDTSSAILQTISGKDDGASESLCELGDPLDVGIVIGFEFIERDGQALPLLHIGS